MRDLHDWQAQEGSETRERLLNWDQGQTSSERLAAQILRLAGFHSIDPSHPLGGSDAGKDFLCDKDGIKWVGAAYFPYGQQSDTEITTKFKKDYVGVAKNNKEGIVFVTNQRIKLSLRRDLEKIAAADSKKVEILHLERMATLLDAPQGLDVRLEYLDIDMTREEQLAFIRTRDREFVESQAGIRSAIDTALTLLQAPESKVAVAEELEKIKEQLTPYFRSPGSLYDLSALTVFAPRHPTINDLEQFVRLAGELGRVLPVVNAKLAELKIRLHGVTGIEENPLQSALLPAMMRPTPANIQVATNMTEEYRRSLDELSAQLDEVIEKERRLADLHLSNRDSQEATKR